MAFVYMLHCADDSLYTGYTPDIGKRLKSHYMQDARCAKYTRSHPVRALACLWETDSTTAARKLEYRIKALQTAEKRSLVQAPEKLYDFFPQLREYTYIHHPEAKLEDYIDE